MKIAKKKKKNENCLIVQRLGGRVFGTLLLQPVMFIFHSWGRNLSPLCLYPASLYSSTKCI